MKFSEVRKAAINIGTTLVTATPWILHSLNEEPFKGTSTATVVSCLLGLLGVAMHYQVPNTTNDPAVAATQSVVLKDSVAHRAGGMFQSP